MMVKYNGMRYLLAHLGTTELELVEDRESNISPDI